MDLPGNLDTVSGVDSTRLCVVKTFDWSPGNMTRYRVVFVRLDLATQVLLGHAADETVWLVVHEGRAMTVASSVYLAPIYVSEKLDVGRGDAEMLVKLIKEVVG